MNILRYLPLLFLGLSGCAALSSQEAATSRPGGAETLATSADEDTNSYRLAITALNNSQLEQAETAFKGIIKTRPEFSGPWINLAIIDIRRNNLESAEKNLSKALERNPRLAQAYNAHGYIEMKKGNIKKAADHYRHAIALKEDYAFAHYNLALLHDTYLLNEKVAVRHYKRYLQLTNNQDKKTADWVAELERNISKESK